jgi:hypothetical protein
LKPDFADKESAFIGIRRETNCNLHGGFDGMVRFARFLFFELAIPCGVGGIRLA